MSDVSQSWMERMESKVDALRSEIGDLKAIRGLVEDHQERIYGNGQPGLIKDVDRLKQWRKSLFWLVGLFGTATAGELLTRILGPAK